MKQSILNMDIYCPPEASVLLASYAVQVNLNFLYIFNKKNYELLGVKTVFRIRISFHADPDPGFQKCPYESGSRPLIFYSDPDPRGVKIK